MLSALLGSFGEAKEPNNVSSAKPNEHDPKKK
jgi:hypothetical protein